MFKLAENVELNQISLTGLRALVFIGLLIVKPRSFDEIKQIFIDLKIMDENSSAEIFIVKGCFVNTYLPLVLEETLETSHPIYLIVFKTFSINYCSCSSTLVSSGTIG